MSEKEKKPHELRPHSASDGVNVVTKQAHYSMTKEQLQSLNYEVNGESGNSKSVNRSFASRKRKSKILVSSFDRLGYRFNELSVLGYTDKQILDEFGLLPNFDKRANNVDYCGEFLTFRYPVTGEGKWTLQHASFCHDRLCPMCMARRSLKIYSQLNEIMNNMDNEQYEYLFLTVTVPNCSGETLDKVCTKILKSFTNMLRRKELKSIVKGYFRSLEVTFNHNKYSKSYMTFHPHLHAILAVPKSYFKKFYIKQSDWLRMWKETYGDDSIQFVNIKKIHASEQEMKDAADQMSIALRKAVAETGKYSVKYSDYLFGNDDALTDYAVMHIARALHSQRLFALGGVFKEVYMSLHMEDVMSDKSDLLHINSDDVMNPTLAYHVVVLKWGSKGMYLPLHHEIQYPEI